MVYRSCIQSIYSYQHQLACDQYLSCLEGTKAIVWIPNPRQPSETLLLYGKKKQRRRHHPFIYEATIHCYDPVSLDLIIDAAISATHQDQVSSWWQLLVYGCLLATAVDTRTQIMQNSKDELTYMLYLRLDDDYIRHSFQKINMMGYRLTWRVATKEDMVAFTSVYFSVLGGAYSSLGKSNHKYAYKAGTLARRQIKLAKWLQDPILECKCWLYYAEDMVMQGRYRKAARILDNQRFIAHKLQNNMLMTMCDFVLLKWKTATKSDNQQQFNLAAKI
ncbi:uncharacterized protein BX664DRAFT_324844 [Halteromyces radiatus]|uniref:uncharacterized protein n=1 Tax=Halteromyces radiatus TaxID=101107 RepID=UPI00221E9F21|nr:uncharacterized protein BX664DRAFT_324844 [Halteromyces radiatus]KAI8096797.1 hypothetical protein BX664DRAFT_324844 [Halteromyces radiatus]